MSGRVRRTPFVDELHHDGECVVLLEDTAVRLGGLAPLVLDLCDEWRTVSDLSTRLVEAYGPPPEGDVEVIVREAVDALVEAGVVEREEP